MPTIDAIDSPKVSAADMEELLCVDREGWHKGVKDMRENHYPKFGDKLPQELADMLDIMDEKLNDGADCPKCDC